MSNNLESKSFRPGQPTKCNRKTVTAIYNAMRLGMYPESAARHIGINQDTYYEWLKLAKTPDAPPVYRQFSEAITRGGEEFINNNLAIINAAATGDISKTFVKDDEGHVIEGLQGAQAIPVVDHKGNQLVDRSGKKRFLPPAKSDWSAGAWLLERRQRAQWNKTEKVEISGPDNGPIEVETSEKDDAAEIERLEQLLKDTQNDQGGDTQSEEES